MTLLASLTDLIGAQASAQSGTSDSSSPLYRMDAALSAMHAIVELVSEERLGQAQLADPSFVGPSTPEQALQLGMGYCGMQFATFQSVMIGLNIPVRMEQVFWASNYATNTGVRL